MHILHVIDSFSPATGGPPEAVRQLIKATRATGTQVEVVCLDSPQAEFLVDLDCPVHALDESFLGRYAFSPRLWRWLRANAGRFDGIIMNGVWTFPGFALRSRGTSRAPAVWNLCSRRARSLVQPQVPAEAPEKAALLALAVCCSARRRGGFFHDQNRARSGQDEFQA
jgi:hypothetical protein